MTEDRGQKTDDRGQMTEDIGDVSELSICPLTSVFCHLFER